MSIWDYARADWPRAKGFRAGIPALRLDTGFGRERVYLWNGQNGAQIEIWSWG